jgi:hypothetical protein
MNHDHRQPFTITRAFGPVKSITYDYEHQAWIVNNRYARCNHPESLDCKCYGKLHEGEKP